MRALRTTTTTLLATCLVAAFGFVLPQPASGHPAPFAHRHVYRPAPKRQVAQRQPRKGPERGGRLVTRWYMGATGRLTGIIPAGAGPLLVDRTGGGGARLYAGVRFTPALSLEFAGHGDLFGDDALLGALTLDLRWVFAHPAARVLPYIRVGIGAYGVNAPSDRLPGEPGNGSGFGGQLAGGVKWRFGRIHLVAGVDLQVTWLNPVEAALAGLSATIGLEFDI